MKNILVAIHYKKNAPRLLAEARKMAKAFGSKIWILHVSEPDPDYRTMEAGPQFLQEKRINKQKQDAALVEELAQEIRENGIEAEALVIKGPTVKTISKKTKELEIDLVVAGHQRKNFFYQMFVGNQEKNIIDELDVPALIVPYVGK